MSLYYPENMFNEATSFNQPIGNWNVSNVTSLANMFFKSSFNHDISNWNVSNVQSFTSTFHNATAFNQNIGNWNISSATTMQLMFDGVTLSTTNYDAILNAWSALSVGETQIPTNITFSGGNSKYSNSGESARNTLINTYGWTITDGGMES